MAMLPSHAHIELILNGFRFDTFADDDPPYDIETEDSANLTTGMTGRKYGNALTAFGGRLMIRLAPHAEGVEQLIKWEIERKRRLTRGSEGYAQVFNGTLKDVVTGIDCVLKGGSIIKIPPRTIAGQSFESTFDFEIIESNIESAAWSRVGQYPGAGATGGAGGSGSVNDGAPGFRPGQ